MYHPVHYTNPTTGQSKFDYSAAVTNIINYWAELGAEFPESTDPELCAALAQLRTEDSFDILYCQLLFSADPSKVYNKSMSHYRNVAFRLRLHK